MYRKYNFVSQIYFWGHNYSSAGGSKLQQQHYEMLHLQPHPSTLANLIHTVPPPKQKINSLLPLSGTAADLRELLKARGTYSETEVIFMIKKAITNPGITKITQASYHEMAATSRKAISVNRNLLLFPDPLDLTLWDTDLRSLPHLTSVKCLAYLLSKGVWSSEWTMSIEK